MANVARYSKIQLVKSKKYACRRDLIGARLEEGKTYTIKEVDTLIEQFMRKAVK